MQDRYTGDVGDFGKFSITSFLNKGKVFNEAKKYGV